MAQHEYKATKWRCMHTAATLSVLALTIASTRAGDHNDINNNSNTPTSATGLVDGREGNSNRPFFIQDPTDGLCLSGGTFKRCAVDTLWKVEGEAGRQLVRRVAVQEDGECCTAAFLELLIVPITLGASSVCSSAARSLASCCIPYLSYVYPMYDMIYTQTG